MTDADQHGRRTRFATIIGTLLGWVGDYIPVWKTGSAAACSSCLVAGAMNTFHLTVKA
ncbi:MAG: hypothetical protein ACLURV_14855 [Gallintestinimicrobium sp.]